MIRLKLGSAHFSAGQIKKDTSQDTLMSQDFIKVLENVPIQSDAPTDKSESKPIVLVIEDNIDLLNFITSCLSKDFSIIHTTNAEEGFEIAKNQLPDLILSDIMLPGINGYLFTSNLRKDFRTSHIPVILLTAKTSEQHQLKGVTSGANQYITKPFNVDFFN